MNLAPDERDRLEAGSHKRSEMNATENLIFEILDKANSALTRRQIERRAFCSDKTAWRGLRRLREAGLVNRHQKIEDGRKYVYCPADEEYPQDGGGG